MSTDSPVSSPRPSQPTRRRWLAWGAAGAAGLGLGWAARPSDVGAPHDAYFSRLSRALRAEGVHQPTLVIDRERLHANARQVRAHLDARLALRLVNKSLPSLSLLDELAERMDTTRQMVFNLPYLRLMAQHRPDHDLLLGKPLPVAAAAEWLKGPAALGPQATQRVQWLIDTPTRLAQYRDLARAQRTPLRINLEIDVGLRRGGVADEATLREMIQLMHDEPWLRWSGLMGYDAHTQKIPDVAGSRARAHEHVLSTYRARLATLHTAGLPQQDEVLTLNTGGSPTYRLHRADGPANEVALGSALVKPSDFDTEALADLQPAAWIATPVLKVQPFRTPEGVEVLGALAQTWDRNQRTAHHLHGGHWLAHPISPAGLQASGLIGPSSNQQLFLGSGRQALQPDELVFFRPTQSEAVLQQFGDIAVVEGDRVTTWWPVFPARA